MRLAAAGDLHVKKTSQGALQPLLAPVNDYADVLLLCGDLTDYGLPEEAVILAKELNAAVRIPIVAVLGNHDFESGQEAEVCRILTDAGVKILDGETYEIGGVGIAGAKGFSGGFGRATLGAWGEQATKRYVQEAIDEALKLERALARLPTRRRIGLLHYAPIRGTVEGEPLDIYPYLGTSRLEEHSTGTRSMSSFTGTRITARPRDERVRAHPYTTWRFRFFCRSIRTGRRFG